MSSRLASVIVMAALIAALATTVRVQASPGDLNCDGATDARDIAPFVLMMIDPAGYEAAYPECPSTNADLNCDGSADPADLDGFVECLLRGGYLPCGPTGMVLVRGCESLMGDWRNEGDINESPPHLVQISTFYMDTYEVPNQQYAEALNWALAQGGHLSVVNGIVFPADGNTAYPYCSTTPSDSFSRITWTGATFGVTTGYENHPMVMVSWYGAAAYCNWRSAMAGRELCFNLSTWACDFSKDGFRLPTEAEWEKAAAWDPAISWPHRFGERTDGCGANCLAGARANFGSSGDPFESGGIPYTTPVGLYDGGNHGGYQTQDAKSAYGCCDLSGNVWEWCYDRYSATYYAESPTTDPTGPTVGTERVQRGGSWFNQPIGLRTTMRNRHAPADRNPNDGFRCVCAVN